MNPYGKSTETSTEHCHCEERSDVAIQATEWHLRLVGHDFLTPNQLGTGLTAGGLPRSRWSLAMTCCAAFTMAARLSRSTESRAIKGLRAHGRRMAFTMAEILLSLTIIGVVAAITLPSLTGNINERTWNTQRKALYARMSQAIALMPALNGYGTLSEETDSAGSTSIIDTAAEVFITDGLAKVMKINNICDNDHIEDCGIPLTYNTMDARQGSMPTTITELNDKMTSVSYSYSYTHNTYSMLDTKAAAFETGNGESILTFYNPNCVTNMGESDWYFAQPKICANMIYDLNGSKGPNTIGKDIGFMTILYPTDSVVVAPMPYRNVITGVTSDEAATACTNQAGEEYRIPTKDELASLFVNKDLISDSFTTGGTYHWYSSSKIVQSTGITNWVMVANYGEYRIPEVGTSNWGILCVKR